MEKSIIDELVLEYPEIEHFKKGFPNIGSRADCSPFGEATSKICEAWEFYDKDLYDIPIDKEIIKFGNGNPLSYKAFPLAKKYLKKELNKELYQYSAAAGDEGHRENIAKYLIQEGYPQYIDYNNVIITDSTTNGFYLILKALFKPYDVIIMTSPNYGLFAFMPERMNVGVELVQLSKDNDFIIRPDDLNKKIVEINKVLKEKYKDKLNYVPRVRAFLNINPHNPLGTVLSHNDIEVLREIGEVCQKNKVFIIDDLIYRDLSYDKNAKAMPIGTIVKYFDNTISLFGLSKSYGLAKTRTGFVVANDKVIRLLRDNVFYMKDSASVLQSSMLAGVYNDTEERKREYFKYFNNLIPKYLLNCYLCMALFDGIESVKGTFYYKKILKLLKKNIKDKNLLNKVKSGVPYAKTVLEPKSGFFLLVDFTDLRRTGLINNEKDLLIYLYKKCGIKFLVGQSFSWPYSDEIIMRMTYSLSPKVLIEAISSINIAIRDGISETNRGNNKS